MSYPFFVAAFFPHLSHISPKKDFSGREIAIYNTWPYREGILEYYSYMQTHGGEHFVYEMVFPPFGTGISVGVTDMLEMWACRCEQADLATNFHVDSIARACH